MTSTITKPVDQLGAQLDDIVAKLAPLLEQMKGVVDARDRLIAVRVGEMDEPVEVEDGVARTTIGAYNEVVERTFHEFEAERFAGAFLAVVRIMDLIDSF